jgi:hypothetical protein
VSAIEAAAGKSVFVPDRDAPETIERLAAPGMLPAAYAIAEAIPNFVPEVTGVMRRSYDPQVEQLEENVHVHVGSPFWHWMEYGTAYNPAYRPVETAVRSLGLRYESQ